MCGASVNTESTDDISTLVISMSVTSVLSELTPHIPATKVSFDERHTL